MTSTQGSNWYPACFLEGVGPESAGSLASLKVFETSRRVPFHPRPSANCSAVARPICVASSTRPLLPVALLSPWSARCVRDVNIAPRGQLYCKGHHMQAPEEWNTNRIKQRKRYCEYATPLTSCLAAQDVDTDTDEQNTSSWRANHHNEKETLPCPACRTQAALWERSYISVNSSGTWGFFMQYTLPQRHYGRVPCNGDSCNEDSLIGGSIKALKPLDVGSISATYIGIDNKVFTSPAMPLELGGDRQWSVQDESAWRNLGISYRRITWRGNCIMQSKFEGTCKLLACPRVVSNRQQMCNNGTFSK